MGKESSVGRVGGGEKWRNIASGRSQQKQMIHAMSDQAIWGGGGWKEAMSILGFDTKCEQEHSEPIELESSRGRRGSLGIRLPQLFLRGEERSNMAEKQMGFI